MLYWRKSGPYFQAKTAEGLHGELATMTYLFHFGQLLILYAVLATALYGWGWVAARLIRIRPGDSLGPIKLIWLGWAAILWVLQVLQLIWPIGWTMSLSVYGVGAGAAAIAHFTRRNLRTPRKRARYFSSGKMALNRSVLA